MIQDNHLRHLLAASPFQPFTVTLASGAWYRIDHETDAVLDAYLLIHLKGQTVIISPAMIEAVEVEGYWPPGPIAGPP